MAILYLPKNVIKRMMKKKHLEKLVSRDLTLNRTAVQLLSRTGVLSKKTLEDVALKVIKGYKKRYKEEIESGATRSEALEDAVKNKKQLINRVQNAAVYEIAGEIKDQYRGEFYEWLPSDADEPDPEHQLKYGQVYQIGVGEMPGDRYGCKCGMNILVDKTRLNL
jgi:hypothetical protein